MVVNLLRRALFPKGYTTPLYCRPWRPPPLTAEHNVTMPPVCRIWGRGYPLPQVIFRDSMSLPISSLPRSGTRWLGANVFTNLDPAILVDDSGPSESDDAPSVLCLTASP